MINIDNFLVVYAFVFVVGACIGSFLNVCIYRIPRGESVVWPGSRCPKCGSRIRWYDNIPILSWFILGGRCRDCKERISFRYPCIEGLTAILFLSSWCFLEPVQAFIGMVFLSLLIVVSFIDLDYLMIPDRLTVGGFILGCVISIVVPDLHGYGGGEVYGMRAFLSAVSALNGAFLGSGLLLWVALISEMILKEESMGGADIKLMGCIGAFCGWKGVVFALCGGAFCGSLILLPLMLMKKLKSRDAQSGYMVVSFGPWLSLGAILYFVFMRDSVDEYFNAVSRLF